MQLYHIQFEYILFEYIQLYYIQFEYILFEYIQYLYIQIEYNFNIYNFKQFHAFPLFVSTHSFPFLEYKMQPECLGENIANVFFHRSRSVLPAIDITYVILYNICFLRNILPFTDITYSRLSAPLPSTPVKLRISDNGR